MTEVEKNKIKKRYEKVNPKVSMLILNKANLPLDVIQMNDELQAFMALKLSKSNMSVMNLYAVIDAEARRIENILKNYE